MKVRDFHVYLTLVTLSIGFLISTSIESTKLRQQERENYLQWQQETQLNERIVAEKEKNRKLEEQLLALQRQVGRAEEMVAQRQSEAAAILQELETARMLAGMVPVEGPGLVITMKDNPNAAGSDDIANYIVHEQDIRSVVNELLAAGAEGIAINGQRLVSSSEIRCVGPTVIVNGVKSAAPFVITAIGDPVTLENALKLPGGILEFLKDYVLVEVVSKERVELPAYVGEQNVANTIS